MWQEGHGLDTSIIPASCLQLCPCCTRGCEPSRAWKRVWCMGQSLHLCPFSSAPSLAQQDERDSKGVPPPWCPEGRQRPSFVHFQQGHTWQQPGMPPDAAPRREGLAASILYLPSMTIKQRGALTSPPSHDPLWCLTGFLKGQIFPLRSHSLGSCSSRPSPVPRLAFPQRSVISPSSPWALTGGCYQHSRQERVAAPRPRRVAHRLTKALAPLPLAVSARSKGPPRARSPQH